MTSKNRSQQKPTKPPSGYNIFYQIESKRARDRERARKLFLNRSSLIKPEHTQAANKTRFIGNKWKTLSQHSQELFLIRGKNELDIYQVNKSLWIAFDKAALSDKGEFASDKAALSDKGESLDGRPPFCLNETVKGYTGSLKNEWVHDLIKFLQ